jgi:hypothetical protein
MAGKLHYLNFIRSKILCNSLGFDCWFYAGGVLLESAVITPAHCVALGGNCCTWDGYAAWNDGLGSKYQEIFVLLIYLNFFHFSER